MASHLAFVTAAYALSAIVIAGLIVWIVVEHRRLTRAIAVLEGKGIRRRSARGSQHE